MKITGSPTSLVEGRQRVLYTKQSGKGAIGLCASQVAHLADAFLRFLYHEATRCFFYSTLMGILVHRRGTPTIKFASTQLYTWVERGTERVKCLAQEHNTMTPVRARAQTSICRPAPKQEARARSPGEEREGFYSVVTEDLSKWIVPDTPRRSHDHHPYAFDPRAFRSHQLEQGDALKYQHRQEFRDKQIWTKNRPGDQNTQLQQHQQRRKHQKTTANKQTKAENNNQKQ